MQVIQKTKPSSVPAHKPLVLEKSTLQLLRFHFSLFLLPVYLFALSQVPDIHAGHAWLIFFILHFLVYPASNGYNSYMDRDTGSIGGVEKPLPPTQQLFQVSLAMDIIAILLSYFISGLFSLCLLTYILASRAYSYRGIRLKQYPIVGYLTVIIFQGAVTFFMVYHGSSISKTVSAPFICLVTAVMLIGGFYPLTQIYQHEEDRKDGITTISYLLGKRGSFVFTAVLYTVSMALLAVYLFGKAEGKNWLIIATTMLPVVVYFMKWWADVEKDPEQANFRNTMRMNLVASVCTNLAFFILLLIKWLE